MCDFRDAVRDDRVIAVIRARRVPRPQLLVDALVAAGIRCVEFTLTTEDALAAIECAAGDAIVGAGTVLTAQAVKDATNAGAAFLATPSTGESVIAAATEIGIPVLGGALTPSEVLATHRAGATAVKLFPARLGGPQYIRDLHAPFPDIDLVPSGGVDSHTAVAFLAAGAIAVCTGSQTIPSDLVERGAYGEITARARTLVEAIRSGRQV